MQTAGHDPWKSRACGEEVFFLASGFRQVMSRWQQIRPIFRSLPSHSCQNGADSIWMDVSRVLVTLGDEVFFRGPVGAVRKVQGGVWVGFLPFPPALVKPGNSDAYRFTTTMLSVFVCVRHRLLVGVRQAHTSSPCLGFACVYMSKHQKK